MNVSFIECQQRVVLVDSGQGQKNEEKGSFDVKWAKGIDRNKTRNTLVLRQPNKHSKNSKELPKSSNNFIRPPIQLS